MLTRFRSSTAQLWPWGLRRATFTAALLAVGAAATVPAGADEITESREVDDFTAVAFAMSGKLILTQGGAAEVTITGDDSDVDRTITEVRNGVLRIRRKRGALASWFDEDVTVEVTFRDLEKLVVSGSGNATLDTVYSQSFELGVSGSGEVEIGRLEADELSIAISGSGDLEVKSVDADTVSSRISGSGNVSLGGRTDALAVAINGSGDQHADDLEANRVRISIAGSGNADVWATDTLDIRIAGSGDITYAGNPAITKKVAGSGDIRQRGTRM